MEVIFLGTGTSQGVPMIACDCAVCTSNDPRNRRTRTSVHVVMDGLHVQVDASPEFVLAAGAAGLGSLQWVKRRRRNVA
jgi:phosphoribosyl 1,2-cyclic phosphate phosphodiesterase